MTALATFALIAGVYVAAIVAMLSFFAINKQGDEE